MTEGKMTEDQVRERAYQLWEQAGCPEGRSAEFWDQATSEAGFQKIESKPELVQAQNVDGPSKAA